MSKVLITGTPRAGIRYISYVCDSLELDVPHEVEFGENGIASWKGVAGKYDVTNKVDHVLHQVRNPLHVISSLHTLMENSFRTINDVVDIDFWNKDLTVKCIKTYIYWNKLIEKKACWRYKIEELYNDDVWLKWCEYMNVNPNIKKPNINKNANSRKHRKKYTPITWNDIFKYGGLGIELNELAIKYGY